MSDRSRLTWLRKTMAGFGLLLLAITWRLWTPQTEFPQIPFFSWLVDIPGFVDWVALLGTSVGLIAMLFTSGRMAKPAIGLFLISIAPLVLLNQHRLQPWAYLVIVTSCLLLCLPNKTCLTWLRRIVISIYIYSAISKLDYQFVFTVGDQMLDVLAGFVGLEPDGLPQWAQAVLVLCLPLTELLIGVLLLFPKTARPAGWLAIGLHASLLLVLGPLGLNHQPGVLVWNGWFIVQAWLLFATRTPQASDSIEPDNEIQESQSQPAELIWLGRILATFVILFPLTCVVSPWFELPVKADHWIAWEVYAPRNSRATARSPVPAQHRPTQPTNDSGLAAPMFQTPNQWSLNQLGVPVYPQDRFQVGCWLALFHQQSGPNRRTPAVIVSGTANRLTGEREQTRIDGPVAAQKYRRRLWFNTRPRWPAE